jgi:hypothetical protein
VALVGGTLLAVSILVAAWWRLAVLIIDHRINQKVDAVVDAKVTQVIKAERKGLESKLDGVRDGQTKMAADITDLRKGLDRIMYYLLNNS